MQLCDESIDLWTIPLADVGDRFQVHEQSLSTDEHQRATRFRSANDRRRFTLARGSLRRILSQYLGTQAEAVRFSYGIHGKPRLANAVNERINEVGLLRALGAGKGQVLMLFLGEALVLAVLGGLAGLLLGAGGAWLIGFAIPALPTHTSWTYVLIAETVAAVIGLAAGVAPAWKAAKLDPIEALRTE